MATSKRKEKRKLYITKKQSEYLLEQAAKTNEQLLNDFESSDKGMTQDKAREKFEVVGPNTLVSKSKQTWYKTLFRAFFSPFTCILIVIAILNVAIPGQQQWPSFGIIMFMLCLAGVVKFIQDFRSNKASEKLNNMINTTAAVERDGLKEEIPLANIVPGDLIHLTAGDMIPADMRILKCKDLFITQSSLTGESEPVEKTMVMSNSNITTALESTNLCFMGTTVASGTAVGLALKTGKETFLGKISSYISKKRPQSSFDKGIKKVSFIIIQTTIILTLIVFLLNGLLPKSNGSAPDVWIQSLIFSLSVAVGLTPEMLPMIVSLNLSKEAIKFSKQKAIIKNANSIQTFGAMDVLCTDKTGTLTEDKIILQEHLNVEGKEDLEVLKYGYLNSYFQTGLKNLIDKAIIDKAEQKRLKEYTSKYSKIDEIPFDFQRRRMSIILKDNVTNEKQLVTKGATEEILSISSHVLYKGKLQPLTKDLNARIKKTVDHLNDNGMRVIAIAKNLEPLSKDHAFCVADEKNMIIIGYIALLDPPKMSAKKAVHSLLKRGVDVKILTGDNERVTKFICRELKLDYKRVLFGSQIESLDFDELKEKVKLTTIFAKLAPEQKALVVRAIKSNGHVVGYMGDGINDAPAMHESDLAISVDSAVDIAKESADVILLEKDLTILNNGILEGRKTYANIIKYIKITISSNFGNMLSMVIASAVLPFSPIQAIQILLLNAVYDFSQLAIPWDNVDEQFLLKPQNWNAKSIIKFMVVFGPVSTIFDLTTFAILWFVFGYNDKADPAKVAAFNTGWFIESALTQSLVLFVLRTRKTPFVQSNPAKSVAFTSVALLAACIAIPYLPELNKLLQFVSSNGTQTLSGYFFLVLLGIIATYILLAQLTKMLYIKASKQHNWL